MPGWLQALILGVLQGLTEFLPVSSSGHLVVFQQWLGEGFTFLEQAVAFDLVLHVGTLLPVLWFYRKTLRDILRGTFSSSPISHEGGPIAWLRADQNRWLAAMVVAATIPTGLIGVGLKDHFEKIFHSTTAVCVALIVTGALLYSTKLFERDPEGTGAALTLRSALLIGLAQGMAITPGISRSGSTIAVALLLGLPRELAARFSFLLSIPAILGAVVLVMKDGVVLQESAWAALAIGFVSSMVVGYLALVMLVALVKRGGIYKFAYYLWPAAIVGLVFLR